MSWTAKINSIVSTKAPNSNKFKGHETKDHSGLFFTYTPSSCSFCTLKSSSKVIQLFYFLISF